MIESDSAVLLAEKTKHQPIQRKQRGVFERAKGSGIWWTRYLGSDGRIHREKAGTWAAARDLYIKRKNEALQGKKLPEKLRRATSIGSGPAPPNLSPHSGSNRLSTMLPKPTNGYPQR